jgi:hypothetical protein
MMDRVENLEQAAQLSEHCRAVWLDYLSKEFGENDKPKLTQKDVERLIASPVLDSQQKILLREALIKGSAVHKYVTTLRKPAELSWTVQRIVDEVKQKKEKEMKTNEERIMKTIDESILITDEDRINLRGKMLYDHYRALNWDPAENSEGEGFYITDDEKTVADVYRFTADEFAKNVEWYGAVTDIREFGGDYLIDWTDYEGEEHSDVLSIWTSVDGELVNVPYSNDAVENAEYE